MSVYVLAVFSHAHDAWAEFMVGRDADLIGSTNRRLTSLAAVRTAVVKVEADDWELIRPALERLGRPDPPYTPKEFAMYCDHRRDQQVAILEAAMDIEAAPGLRIRAPRGGHRI